MNSKVDEKGTALHSDSGLALVPRRAFKEGASKLEEGSSTPPTFSSSKTRHVHVRFAIGIFNAVVTNHDASCLHPDTPCLASGLGAFSRNWTS